MSGRTGRTGEAGGSALAAAGLVVFYTLAVTLSDAFTKHLASTFEAPQVLVLCAGTILALSLLAHRRQVTGRNGWRTLATAHPAAMSLRAVMTVLAACFFYYAFAALPFADVFLFIALVPIIAGLLSAPILGERVSALTWVTLGLAAFGVFLIFPDGRAGMTSGHLCALLGAFTGTLAIVMSRYISRRETTPLAQVFWPQAAVFVTMALVAPLVWQPIGWTDTLIAIACGLALFAARYALVVALQMLPAYTATPLLNLQFVWMVLIGMVAFNEVPDASTFIGAGVIIATGLLLVWEQYLRDQRGHGLTAQALIRPGLRRSRA